MDGRITCGLSTVWKTGNDAIIGLMRQIVSADDLAVRDLVERDMWDEHIIRNLIVGHDLRSAIPSIWRSGHELPLEEAEQLIAGAREKWQPADIRLRWTPAAEDELAAYPALRALPRYHRWLAWRLPSGLSEPELTAADVVRYERDVLGNDNNVPVEAIAELGNLPVSRVLWISDEKSVAERYNPGNDVIALDVALCPIIGDDGEQGYLPLLPQASNW